MKRLYYAWATAALMLGMLLLAQGCLSGTQLRSELSDPRALGGTFDLMLYGCRYPDDIENAAFLVPAESAIPLELFVSDTSYKLKKGLSAEKAVAEADAFVRCGVHTVQETRFHRILDTTGTVVGYDVIPRYLPYEIGGPDPLLVTYVLSSGRITAYVRLKPEVERQIMQFDAPAGGTP
ncbi:MAG: hypothetical protein ACYC7L_15850 [Nitrospirota bacterium]